VCICRGEMLCFFLKKNNLERSRMAWRWGVLSESLTHLEIAEMLFLFMLHGTAQVGFTSGMKGWMWTQGGHNAFQGKECGETRLGW
jgi:hypothetical protein